MREDDLYAQILGLKASWFVGNDDLKVAECVLRHLEACQFKTPLHA